MSVSSGDRLDIRSRGRVEAQRAALDEEPAPALLDLILATQEGDAWTAEKKAKLAQGHGDESAGSEDER